MASNHFGPDGQARMVDVSEKAVTVRTATAETIVLMQPKTMEMIQAGTHRKGDVLAVARLAAIMGCKQTASLIPLCHAIPIEGVDVTFEPFEEPTATEARLRCQVTVRTTAKTGIEMEAMTGASIAGLTLYDMCKSVDRRMELESIRVVAKAGGKSGDWSVD
ncbi:Cyclic pyranopterin monophosphate synthase accessory protein [Roseimaritima multifibrata]|uniref:Cyclic pyranopterin monophosphate synthase n=1 Tax=Roseimaritima multifibrata TaxID=1930274 RepID=A0A517MDL6_9BACT|nr:cyclic pyranopterin monophosphate synthase MoaC [Roseimaritima multifibrata]QDS92926.1 Cyclic pyranopterin monophosphate synthase accessory protein [Roseimaritima multifibrata]